MRYFSGNFTHMQPIEIQHMQSQRTMHVDKPQRPRLGHAMSKLHLLFSLTFSSSKISHKLSCSPLPRVHKSEFSPTLHSFLPRKVLGSSLESSSQVHRFTHQKKDKTPPKSLPLSSFCWLPQTESPAARRKLLSTLPSSLPLIFSGPATRKGKPFHVSLYIYIYIYICYFKKL